MFFKTFEFEFETRRLMWYCPYGGSDFAEVQSTTEKIKEKNLTALMITHNLQDALTYGNRMLLLHQGEIVRDFSEEEKKKLSVTDLYKIMVELDEKDN